MSTRYIDSTADLTNALNAIMGELRDLHSEVAVTKILSQHAIGLLVRRAQDPKKYFEEIRSTSRINIEENLNFDSGDPEANEIIRQKALTRHEQMFEEMRRALGFRDTPTH